MRLSDVVFGLMAMSIVVILVSLSLTNNPTGNAITVSPEANGLFSVVINESNRIAASVENKGSVFEGITKAPYLGEMITPVVGLFENAQFILTLFKDVPVVIKDLLAAVFAYLGVPSIVGGIILAFVSVWIIFKIANILWRKEEI